MQEPGVCHHGCARTGSRPTASSGQLEKGIRSGTAFPPRPETAPRDLLERKTEVLKKQRLHQNTMGHLNADPLHPGGSTDPARAPAATTHGQGSPGYPACCIGTELRSHSFCQQQGLQKHPVISAARSDARSQHSPLVSRPLLPARCGTNLPPAGHRLLLAASPGHQHHNPKKGPIAACPCPAHRATRSEELGCAGAPPARGTAAHGADPDTAIWGRLRSPYGAKQRATWGCLPVKMFSDMTLTWTSTECLEV